MLVVSGEMAVRRHVPQVVLGRAVKTCVTLSIVAIGVSLMWVIQVLQSQDFHQGIFAHGVPFSMEVRRTRPLSIVRTRPAVGCRSVADL